MNKTLKRVAASLHPIWIIALGLCIGIILRIPLFPVESHDFIFFLKPWYEIFQSTGGFGGLAHSFAGYPPPYLTFIAAISTWSLPPLISIKLFSIFFDLLLGLALWFLVWIVTRNQKHAAWGAALVFVFPTVILNSAAWGQADSMFAAFAVGGIAAAMKKKSSLAVGLWAASLALKPQAIFLAPLYVALFIRGDIRLRHFWPAPLVYLCSILPALIAGRSLESLFGIYPSLATEYQRLSYFTPNIYQLVGVDVSTFIATLGIIASAVTALIFITLFVKTKIMTPEAILGAALFLSLAMPFLLPHMHERYFYLAEVFSVAYAFALLRRWYVPVILSTTGFASYSYLLFLKKFTPEMVLLGCFMLITFLLAYISSDMLTLIRSLPKTHRRDF